MIRKERIYEDLTLVLKRVRISLYVLAGLFVLLMGYYWKVQVFDHAEYWRMAEANRLRERLLPAPRGVITDRGGLVVLADNTAGFKVSIIRENVKDYEKSCRDIGALLGVPPEDLKKRIEKYSAAPAFLPVVVKDNMTQDEIARIEARKIEFPEVEVGIEPRRCYPFGKTASHVLGYLQEISSEMLKEDKTGKKHLGDLSGRTGIEYEYDGVLTGDDGRLLEVVNSLGRSMGEMTREEPRQGRKLVLSLDFDLQRKAEELLEGKEGAIVVLDPKTGEVLALASYPNYDPNKFISRFTPEEWMRLTGDPANPLENRAVRGLYSPGSIFKIVMAAAALDAGFITPDTAYYCTGSTEIYGAVRNCWFKPGHGMMDLPNAIKNSCNIYFYNLGRRMGIEPIASYARAFGLGRKTGIDIPGEKDGLVPDPEWRMKTSKTPWYKGETISVAIGQGPLLVTPLQAAALTARVANRGTSVVPHLATKANAAGDTTPSPAKPGLLEAVIRGMWKSVNDEGTGKAAKVEGFDVCGKTGSTQWISAERAEKLAQQGKEVRKTHSWFSGFAPMGDPRIVVTVLVEFGGGGAVGAAPLAGEIFKLYREKYAR